jgi:hypothetical protein
MANKPANDLILRTMNKGARLMGWGDRWGDDDYVILNGERSIGRIYKDAIPREPRGFGLSTPRHFLPLEEAKTAVQATI